MSTKLAGVILAGGKSRRFGSPKAFATRQGTPFYQYSLQVLQSVTSSIVLVTNPNIHQYFHTVHLPIKIINDIPSYRGLGPVAGMYAAMEEIQAEWYVVIPIDVPFIEEWVIQRLLECRDESYDAIVPNVLGQKQPLVALYRHSIKAQLVAQLEGGDWSLKGLLANSKVNYVAIDDPQPFININHKHDYHTHISSD